MEDKKNINELFNFAGLKLEDLDGIAGGNRETDMTPEERKYILDLYEAYNNCPSTEWERKEEIGNRMQAFADEMTRKYGE